MANLQKCPRCGNKKTWAIRRGKRKCSACEYEWRANRLPLHLSRAEWKRLLRWFLLGQSSPRIAEEAHLDRKKGIKGPDYGKEEAVAHDIPPVFEGLWK